MTGEGKQSVCPSRVHWQIKPRRREKFEIMQYQYLPIGRCLKAYRIQAGIPQRKMADRLGLLVVTYSNYENGYSNPSMETIQYFCEILGIGVNEFFRYVVEKWLKRQLPEKVVEKTAEGDKYGRHGKRKN